MEEALDDVVDSSVGFIYKAMLSRDPKKRRVKPVQKHMIQLDFGLDDSEDDSDYEAPKDVSDASDVDTDNEGVGNDEEEEEEEDSSDGDQDENGAESENGSFIPPSEDVSVSELLDKAESIKSDTKASGDGSNQSNPKKLKVLICCVCLGEISEEEDEIVDCDGCGVSVHEGCYGISESQSVASTVSSASTEPWFCDACKAGVKPKCELCPNSGGIYKETDAGKWVHIVCALYIPGVAFGDVDKLSPVTLFEMPYSKWGARECSLCEDERFSRTGVCIGCDAGLCRNYFHVTCAQREGLLSEASPEEDIADPFYAYCKQHAEKYSMRIKRRNWLAIQKRNKGHIEVNTLDAKEKARVQRKLNRHRQKYTIAKLKRPPSWVPQEKMPRLLTTSPSAVRSLMKKAELLGISTQVQNTASSKGDIRKKWHVSPAMSVEFISYYLDRNVRMNNMKTHLKELLNQNQKLQEQETILRVKYDQLSKDVDTLRGCNGKLLLEGEEMWQILSDLAGKELPLPEIIKPKKEVVVSPTRPEMPRSPPAVIHQCGICCKTNDQHQLAKCDKCRKYYHLGCLDPPLSRMPKKTKLCGWQCSECVTSGSEVEASKGPNPNAPRRLREKIKEPIKFTPPGPSMKKGGKKQGRAKKKPLLKRPKEEASVEDDIDMPVLKKERPYRPKHRPSKPQDMLSECATCNKPGGHSNMVKCDECQLCYHFLCLDPPLKKSPKQRGYTWHCEACDPTESTVRHFFMNFLCRFRDDFTHLCHSSP